MKANASDAGLNTDEARELALYIDAPPVWH